MKIERLDVGHLTPEMIDRFTPLTTDPFACCLHGKDPYGIADSEIYALTIKGGNTPIGLLLGTYHPVLKNGTLHSLFVIEKERHKGYGNELLKAFIDLLNEKGSLYLSTLFSSNEITSDYEKMLDHSGWTPPSLLVIRCHYESCYTFHPDWFIYPVIFPKDYSVFPWRELSHKDRERVEYLKDQRGIPAIVDPFISEEKIEPLNSLGLRYKDEIIGWMVNERLDENLILYAKFYVLPEHRKMGIAIKMLIHSIRLQQLSPVQKSLFETNVEYSDPSWVAFVQTRLRPYTSSTEEIYRRELLENPPFDY